MAIGDMWRVQVQAMFLGQTHLNALYFECKTATDPTQAQMNALAIEIKDLHRSRQADVYAYQRWKAVQVRGLGITYPPPKYQRVGGLFLEGNFVTNTNGSMIDTQQLPPQCAFVTTLKSPNIGRSRRGRIYVGGLTESQQQGGVWDPATISTFTTSWTTFMAKYVWPSGTSPDFSLGIWSETIATGNKQKPGGGYDHVANPSPETAGVGVISVVHRSTVYTQRRRTVGVGI
jgi:hypothetical protein